MKFTDFLWYILIIGFVIWGIESYFSIPVVHWSTSQDRCVKVVYDGIETDCNELPEKYERVWVK